MTEHAAQQTQSQIQNSSKMHDVPISQAAQPERLSTRDIVQLQRIIGNRGVQRLIVGGLPSRARIQRTDAAPSMETVETDHGEGLLADGVPDEFAKPIFDFIQDPKNAQAPMTQFVGLMQGEVNKQLAVFGAPPVTLHFDSTIRVPGQFSFATWTIESSRDLSEHVGDSSQQLLINDAVTMFHEARHAEQHFRMAQLSIMEGLDQGIPLNVLKPKVAAFLYIPEHVVESAANSAIGVDFDPAVRKEIKQWIESLYGVDSNYRNVTYAVSDVLVKPFDKTAYDFHQLIPDDYDFLPPDQQEAVKARAQPFVEPLKVALKQHLADGFAHRDSRLQPEFERVAELATNAPDDKDTVMRDHLRALMDLISNAPDMDQLPNDPADLHNAILNGGYTRSIGEELTRIHDDLPEEQDSNEADKAARAALEKLQNDERGWW